MVLVKNYIGRFVSVITLATALSGCSEPEIHTLKSMPPVGSSYSQALANEYKQLASKELRVSSFDDAHSSYFARKGERAALGEGESLEPERLEIWNLSERDYPQLHQARMRLLKAFAANSRKIAPQASAAAMRHFDEWVEQTAKAVEPKKIAKACNAFYAKIKIAEDSLARPAHPVVNDYEILFEHNRATLTEDGQDILDQIVRKAFHHQIILKGETDASGSKAYNRALSKRRAEAVKNALIRRGIPARNIVTVGLGKAPGADVHDAQERHVTILIR